MSQTAWNNRPFRLGGYSRILLMRDSREQYKNPGRDMRDLTTVQKQTNDE